MISVFCCYSYADKKSWETLERHLAILKRSGQVVIHDCHKIQAGTNYILECNAYLDRADIVLLILSHNFVADDLCWDMMLRAMQRYQIREVKVIPIRFSPVYYQIAPFAQLPTLPRGEKFITQWDNYHTGFKDVVEGIYEIIEALLKERQNESNNTVVDEPAQLVNEQPEQLIVQPFESIKLLDFAQGDFKQ